MKRFLLALVLILVVVLGGFLLWRWLFSPERLNIVGRTIGTTFGFDHGVVEFYSMGQLKHRFLEVEKLTTAKGTYENQTRPYRFGYGFHDLNLNFVLDPEERALGKVYFEIPIYADYLYFDAKRPPAR